MIFCDLLIRAESLCTTVCLSISSGLHQKAETPCENIKLLSLTPALGEKQHMVYFRIVSNILE